MSAAQSPDPLPDDDPTRAPAGSDRADWLVGADEGLLAEIETARPDAAPPARPVLFRPAAPGAPVPAVPAPTPAPVAPPAPMAGSHPGAVKPELDTEGEFERGPSQMVWEPGARSVPTLRHAMPAHLAPDPTHDFPMDDAEERARYAVPEEPFVPTLHEVVAPEVFDVVAAPVPWWIHAAHTLRTDRRIQMLLGAALVVLAAVALWPRGERPMSVANLRRHAERVDGAGVLVAGKVGQVFQVGGGYAFYLLDGRDTLVVFTRVRKPVERQRISVRGTMSTGYLDGQPTLALFEANDGVK